VLFRNVTLNERASNFQAVYIGPYYCVISISSGLNYLLFHSVAPSDLIRQEDLLYSFQVDDIKTVFDLGNADFPIKTLNFPTLQGD